MYMYNTRQCSDFPDRLIEICMDKFSLQQNIVYVLPNSSFITHFDIKPKCLDLAV